MKSIALASLLLAGISPSVFAGAYSWVTYGGSQYAITQQSESWVDAEAEAVLQGGHLASIADSNENDFVANFALQFAIQNQVSDKAWIGFTDSAVEGTFGWTDGSPVTFTNWSNSEPNDFFGEDATATNWSAFGNWNDLPSGGPDQGGDTFHYGVIERSLESEPVPEVQTYASLFGAGLIALQALRRRRAARV